MKFSINIRVFGNYYHFYRRKVGRHMVFTIYVNGDKKYQHIKE